MSVAVNAFFIKTVAKRSVTKDDLFALNYVLRDISNQPAGVDDIYDEYVHAAAATKHRPIKRRSFKTIHLALMADKALASTLHTGLGDV